MKKQIVLSVASVLLMTLLTGCGQDAELTAFKREMDDFCTRISEIDTSINNIDAASENATTKLLEYLGELDIEFQEFAELEFPEDFDYLEDLADESSQYMTQAVASYHDAYENGYDEAMGAYAKENYSRAYKRIQIIIAFLHGEKPEDVNLSTEES